MISPSPQWWYRISLESDSKSNYEKTIYIFSVIIVLTDCVISHTQQNKAELWAYTNDLLCSNINAPQVAVVISFICCNLPQEARPMKQFFQLIYFFAKDCERQKTYIGRLLS